MARLEVFGAGFPTDSQILHCGVSERCFQNAAVTRNTPDLKILEDEEQRTRGQSVLLKCSALQSLHCPSPRTGPVQQRLLLQLILFLES